MNAEIHTCRGEAGPEGIGRTDSNFRHGAIGLLVEGGFICDVVDVGRPRLGRDESRVRMLEIESSLGIARLNVVIWQANHAIVAKSRETNPRNAFVDCCVRLYLVERALYPAHAVHVFVSAFSGDSLIRLSFFGTPVCC